MDKTFGFDTAVEEAQRAINSAYIEVIPNWLTLLLTNDVLFYVRFWNLKKIEPQFECICRHTVRTTGLALWNSWEEVVAS